MTIIQMECSMETAYTGSMSKAGKNLFISQQAVSRQIKALETELGFPVLERCNVGVLLTPAGEILYEEWGEVMRRYRTSVDKARDLYFKEQKNIRIGISDIGNQIDNVTEQEQNAESGFTLGTTI